MSTTAIILIVFAGAVAACAGAFVYGCTVPSSAWFRPVLHRGPGDGKRLALTFDDGPASPFTEQILDILRERNVPATFFLCGRNVERYPEIARRIVQEGHTLGNHTYAHPFLYFKSRRRIAQEIDRTQRAIAEATGIQPRVFRPPYGGRWFGLMPVLAERGLRLVMWSATGYDWKLGTVAIVRSTLREIDSGRVLLLHDGRNVLPAQEIDRSATVKALPEIIDRARQAGFTFVPLPDFIPES